MKRKIFLLAILFFFVAGGVIVSGLLGQGNSEPVTAPAAITPAAGEADMAASSQDGVVGGRFSLINHHGEPVTQADFAGGYKLVFFGFTHCPDVCPAGLNKIAKTYELLGEPDEGLQTLFITVDPERDTPDVMKEYVAMFHDDFIGLTGSRAQIDEAINAFKVYASKAEEDKAAGHYMMNHSAYIYLLGPDNNAVEFFGSGDSAVDIADTVRPLLGSDRS